MPTQFSPQPARTRRLKELLENPTTFATTLLVIALDQFGDDPDTPEDESLQVLNWAPEVLHHEILVVFQAAMPPVNLAKLMVAIDMVKSDQFYRSLPRFIFGCNILSGSLIEPNEFDPADCAEMGWGITEAMLIYTPEALQPDGDGNPFSLEIVSYIGEVLKSEGITSPPDVLRIGLSDSDPDPMNFWTDDPELYQGMFEKQVSRGNEIRDMIKSNLDELFQQLAELPLINGKTDDLKRILQSRAAATSEAVQGSTGGMSSM